MRCDDRFGIAAFSGVEVAEDVAVGSVGRARMAAPVDSRFSLSS